MRLKDCLVLIFVLQWARIPKSFNISWSVASLWKSQSTLTLDLLSLNLVRSKFKIPFHGRQLQKLASAQWLGRSTLIIKILWVNKSYMILKLGKGPSISQHIFGPFLTHPNTHPFNPHPKKWFEGYPVKSTLKNLPSFFQGACLLFFLIYKYTVNNYMQVTGIATGENFAFFIYRHFVEIL